MAKIIIPEGLTGKSLFQFLVSNKKALVAEKKFETKLADPFTYKAFIDKNGNASKSAPVDQSEDPSVIQRACIINSCNFMDSHDDVHIPGLWKKSLSQIKLLYLLQEHSMTFKGIITDDLQAFTKVMSWTALGLESPGDTEVLVFLSNIHKDRNEFMFNEYKMNRVKNHSVGMRYVDIQLAINDADEYYKEEFAVWNKYIGQIVNASDAEGQGYFWAIREAKVIEGSAVPLGSNAITPTLSSDTVKEPPAGTWQQPSTKEFDLGEAIKSTKFF